MKRRTSGDELDFEFVDITVRAADEDEFEEAKSKGCSFGYLEVNGLPAFVEFGTELENKSVPFLERYPKTRYKCFENCKLKVAATDDLLDKKIYLHIFENRGVVLIY